MGSQPSHELCNHDTDLPVELLAGVLLQEDDLIY
jgi:hypothetical protein